MATSRASTNLRPAPPVPVATAAVPFSRRRTLRTALRRARPLLLVVVLGTSFLLKLHHLDHAALNPWDEAIHAIVARNVLDHPLRPTLVDVPYASYDFANWGDNHVWLHKPILPFWQIALSFALLGVNTLALRLPSALLATGAVWLTYLIGKELFDRRAGLIAATLQAFCPALTYLVHGYLFGDHVDVALLFWVEASVYCLTRAMRTGAWGDVLLMGVVQGLAFLSKSYLGFAVTGLALTAWLAPRLGLGRREGSHVRGVHLLGMLAATLATVAPWSIYCLIHYPHEFLHQFVLHASHLTSSVDAWGAPWDRQVFDYSIFLYHVFYTPVLVAAVALLVRALEERDTGLWVLYTWALGVLTVRIVATTKTPFGTVIGMPPFFLLLGVLVADAWRERRVPLAAWTGIMVLSLLLPGGYKEWGKGYPESPEFAALMRQALWVVWHVLGALALALGLLAAGRLLRRRDRARERWLWGGCLGLATVVMLYLGLGNLLESWAVTQINRQEPTLADVADFAERSLPANAVLLFDEKSWGAADDQTWGEHQQAMFRLRRTCYSLRARNLEETARQVVEVGGVPYVVSYRKMPLPTVYVSKKDQRILYSWLPSEQVAQERPPARF